MSLSTGLVAPVVRPLARAPQETARICPKIALELVEAISARALGRCKLAWDACDHVLEWTLTSALGSTELRRWCHGTPLYLSAPLFDVFAVFETVDGGLDGPQLGGLYKVMIEAGVARSVEVFSLPIPC